MIISVANRLQNVQEYYFSRKLREIRTLNAQGKDIINVGIGSPDLMPSPQTINALMETAQLPNAHGYQSYTGIPALREAMSSWYQRTYQVNIDSNGEVLPLMGSKEGIMHISMAFLNAGDGVLVPNPGYLTYSSVSSLVGAKIITYDLDEQNHWQPNWEQLEAMDLSGVKLMWVNYPNMPTGADASDALFQRLIEFAHRHQLLVINDNPYSLVLNSKPKSILQYEGSKSVAIELNSLSKSHNMAGWRIGMLVGHPDYLHNILRVKSNMDSGMFLGLQKAAIQALQNDSIWHQQQNQIYWKRKVVACQILKQLGCVYNEEQVGLFVWAKIPPSIHDVEAWVDQILQQARVFLTPGFIFGSRGEQYVRISLCCSVERLEEALERVVKNGRFA